MPSMEDRVEMGPRPRPQHPRGRDAAVWDPTDDLCPAWWPRRPRGLRARRNPGDLPVDQRAADRIYTALTMIASTFELSDETFARQVRALAVTHARDAASVLARGATHAWAIGEQVCPPVAWAPARGSSPALPVPGRGGELLDGLGLLQTYSLAAKIPDASARQAATTAIGQALLEHSATVARIFT